MQEWTFGSVRQRASSSSGCCSFSPVFLVHRLTVELDADARQQRPLESFRFQVVARAHRAGVLRLALGSWVLVGLPVAPPPLAFVVRGAPPSHLPQLCLSLVLRRLRAHCPAFDTRRAATCAHEPHDVAPAEPRSRARLRGVRMELAKSAHIPHRHSCAARAAPPSPDAAAGPPAAAPVGNVRLSTERSRECALKPKLSTKNATHTHTPGVSRAQTSGIPCAHPRG
jgi:hypothetical protein